MRLESPECLSDVQQLLAVICACFVVNSHDSDQDGVALDRGQDVLGLYLSTDSRFDEGHGYALFIRRVLMREVFKTAQDGLVLVLA